jgi:uncharacterized OsmC-like protein
VTADQVRKYQVEAQSTNTFGRVLASARQHHFVIDGPVQNGCPGEALTPPEAFLAGVAACGVELLQVIARDQSVSLQAASVTITAVIDRQHPVRPDLTLFNAVYLGFHVRGPTRPQAEALIEAFKRR